MASRWLLKTHWLLILPLIAVMIMAVACGEDDTPVPVVIEKEMIVEKEVIVEVVVTPTAMPEVKKAPDAMMAQDGGIFALHKHGDARLLDPHVSSSGTESGTFDFMYSQITATSNQPPTSEIVGDLAKSWDVSADGLAYTFNLKENVKWSDGEPLTAADIKFSLDRIVMEGEVRPKSGLLRTYYDSAEVVDDLTAKVNLKFAAAAFLPGLSFVNIKVLPKHVLDAGVDIALNRENIVGSGPYIFTKLRKGDSIELEKNPNYHKDGLPHPDGVKQFIITDTGRTIAAFEAKQVMASSIAWTGLSTQDHVELGKNNDHITTHVAAVMGSNSMFINIEAKPLDDPRVRKALFLLMDRRQHVKIFTLGQGFPHGGLPSWLPFGKSQEDLAEVPGFRYTDAGEKHPDDIAEAKALLADAGLGDGFDLEITVRQTGQYADQAAVVKDQWAPFGINVKIRSMESAAGFAAYDARDFEVGIINTGFPITDADAILGTLYMPNGDINYAHWEDPKLNDFFTKQANEPDPDKRIQILAEVDDFLLSGENHLIGIMWTPSFYTVSNSVMGWHNPGPTAAGNVYEAIWLAQ